MTGIRSYLLAVAATALLLSLVMALLPKGKIRQTACFIGSLLMVLTTLSPVMKLDPEQLAKAIAHLQIETENLRTGVEISSRELQGDIIKQQCETYILDKATAMGLTLEIEIQLHEDGQFPYPTGVVIRGSWTVAEQAALSAVITQDLGIPEERQEWISM